MTEAKLVFVTDSPIQIDGIGAQPLFWPEQDASGLRTRQLAVAAAVITAVSPACANSSQMSHSWRRPVMRQVAPDLAPLIDKQTIPTDVRVPLQGAFTLPGQFFGVRLRPHSACTSAGTSS